MEKQTETMSSFSDLPQELLNSSAAIEPSPESLRHWFLRYGNSPHCSIIIYTNNTNNTGRRYNIHLPEIADSTCVTSLGGWLLFLSTDSSMFFFSPFSRSKINLPLKCPFDFHDLHFAAAFSHSPTHRDCSVVVLRRNSDDSLELCLLGRGDSEWRRYHYNCPISDFKETISVIHYEGAFHFVDDMDNVVFFDDKLKSWSKGRIVEPPSDKNVEDGVIFNVTQQELSCSIIMLWTALEEMISDLGIDQVCCKSICGTSILTSPHLYHLIRHQKLVHGTQDDDTQLKGLWIQPRLHQISPNQTW